MNLFETFKITTSLRNALADLGFTKPTTIQQKAFSPVLSGKDICGIAQTGTGKTIAYLLPLLCLWKYSKENSPTILIMVPTRELVTQVIESIEKLTTYMTLQAVGVYGGVNINTQRLNVERKLDIVVGTPGRIFDLAMNGSLKLKKIRHLVIDEVDEMLDQGFRTQMINILDLLPPRRQNLMFSATLTEDVEAFIDRYFELPLRIEAAPSGTALENIEQSTFELPNFFTKKNMLEYLLATDQSMQKVLVFASTKKMADALFEALDPALTGITAVIHSNKAQNYRFQTVKDFQAGVIRYLIATDIVARGIDVLDVTHVINFDMPAQPEDYMHRIGRTGRADKKGVAISFYTEKEKPLLQQAEQLMNRLVPVEPLPSALEISTQLTDDELPKVFMKEIQVKLPDKSEAGPAFHPKSAKNSKVNFTMSRKDRMMQKYGKPKTRGQKKKKR